MAEADISVDLFNPGQVFACLGFLEAADILLGDAEGGFDWRDEGNIKFRLHTKGEDNPFTCVLAFLARAEIKCVGPVGYTNTPAKKEQEDTDEQDNGEDDEANLEMIISNPAMEFSETFPAKEGDWEILPIRIFDDNHSEIELGHWVDGSSRENLKLYSGNRSACGIARAMLKGVRKKPTKKQKVTGNLGEIVKKGISQLWDEDAKKLTKEPFHVLGPMGGSFNFDPRGAWIAIDAGYSPNKHSSHVVKASPVVEFLAAWGLENARPKVPSKRQVHYAVWGDLLPPMLARAALIGAIPSLPIRHFRFKLNLSGKNKIVTFSEEEI